MTIRNTSPLNEADQELLSAYLDNELTAAEQLTLERRLQQEPALNNELSELRALKATLSDLPAIVPPRSFTLDPATVGKPRGMPLFGLLRFGSALATVLLALTLTLDLFGGASSNATSQSPAPMIAQEAVPEAQPAEDAAASKLAPGGDSAALAATPAAEATVNAQAERYGQQAPTEGETQTTSPSDAVANGSAGSVLNSPQSPAPPPQAAELQSAAPTIDTSPPDTNASELQPVIAAQPAGLGALRWMQILLATVALACGVGAALAWYQKR